MKIRRDAEQCHGCRACELMCSFHHHGCVSPDASSITVRRENSTGRVFWSVDETCDFCRGEKEAWCEKCCAYGALKVAP